MSATKSAPKKGHSRFESYDQLIPHTEKALASRRELAIGRGGAKVKPRKFHLSDEEVGELKGIVKELGKANLSEKLLAINPHNKGFYHYLFAALAEHPNEKVPQGRVMKRVETLMSDEDTIQGEGRDKTTAWERWANKDPRNPDTGKDMEGRFDQNVTVLQRLTGLTPYGRRIFDLHKVIGGSGVVIDVLVADTGTKYLRLNTDSERPVNESKVRGMGSPAAIAEERKASRAKAKRKSNRKNGGNKAKNAAPAPTADSGTDSTPATATADNGTSGS